MPKLLVDSERAGGAFRYACMEAPVLEPEVRASTALYVVPPTGGNFTDEHERCTRMVLGRELAKLKDFRFAGELSGEVDTSGPTYFLPADALSSADARRLGIDSEENLFGGVVPHPFVATKAITHGLVSPDSAAPEGWARDFSEKVAEVTLSGFTAFTRADAEEAARRLLKIGPIQLKPALGIAGLGQGVADTLDDLMEWFDQQDWDGIRSCGLILEHRLTDSTTYSVGQVRVAGLTASYYGFQKEVPDESGRDRYEGSALLVARGGFDALLDLDLPEAVRTAVERARTFDEAADASYPGFFASRRNYDVIRGFDPDGKVREGVLEQSWRVGGASGAEILALRAFADQPSLESVKTRTIEHFGELVVVPPEALLLHRGIDPRIGPITKYATYEHP